nr:MAG TPA: hypothetical protein [Caudoviricetes sp.]
MTSFHHKNYSRQQSFDLKQFQHFHEPHLPFL